MNDLVSILIPIYGVEKYIKRCAESLFAQTYQNLEYIFIDDCTPDRSVEVLKQVLLHFPNRKEQVCIIRHQHNQGLAVARNTALEAAHGKYVMHVDSDDFIDKTTVEKAIQKMHEESADVVIFGMNHIFKDKVIAEKVEIPSDPKEYAAKLLARKCPVCVCGGLYLRSLYIDNDVRAIPGLNMGEDYATKPRLIYYANKVASLKEPLYDYVHYNDGSYTCTFSTSHIDNMISAINTLEHFFRGKSDASNFNVALTKAKGEVWGELLISWALNAGSFDEWDRLRLIYPHLKLSQIVCSRKIVIILAKHNLYNLLRAYCKIGFTSKQILKRLRSL